MVYIVTSISCLSHTKDDGDFSPSKKKTLVSSYSLARNKDITPLKGRQFRLNISNKYKGSTQEKSVADFFPSLTGAFFFEGMILIDNLWLD